MAAAGSKKPGDVVREYMTVERQGDTIWDGIVENVVRLWDGLVFAMAPARLRTWIMIVLTCLATFACSEGLLDLSWDTSLAVVAVGTVFPVVFSIQAAYSNRERALSYLDDLKSTIIYVYFTMGEWDRAYSGQLQPQVEATLCKLCVDMMKIFRDEHGDKAEAVHVVYDGFQKLIAQAHENSKVPAGMIGGMCGTVRSAMMAFEGTRTLKDYETPRGLRKLCYFLIITTPILLAPYWAHFCNNSQDAAISLAPNYGCVAAYFVGILYVVITGTLLRVQEALEDPFDGYGIDDIDWDRFAGSLDKLPLLGKEGEALRKAEAAKQDQGYQQAGV